MDEEKEGWKMSKIFKTEQKPHPWETKTTTKKTPGKKQTTMKEEPEIYNPVMLTPLTRKYRNK